MASIIRQPPGRRQPAPAPLPKPNKRLDAKTELFDYERWNRDWARNADDPASYAPEYEGYIRQIEPTHGHDPGLIFARDFAQRVQDIHGTGGAFVKSLLNRLVDRPDLQRAFLGGDVPQHPPQGTFRPGGEAAVKAWIDQDRVANGIAPKYSKAAQTAAPEQRLSSRAAAQTAPTQEPDPKNILEYVPNFGYDAPEPPIRQIASQAATNHDPFAGFLGIKDVVERRRRREAEAAAATGQSEIVGPISGARFTEGISTQRTHASPQPEPIPPEDEIPENQEPSHESSARPDEDAHADEEVRLQNLVTHINSLIERYEVELRRAIDVRDAQLSGAGLEVAKNAVNSTLESAAGPAILGGLAKLGEAIGRGAGTGARVGAHGGLGGVAGGAIVGGTLGAVGEGVKMYANSLNVRKIEDILKRLNEGLRIETAKLDELHRRRPAARSTAEPPQ